MAGVDGFGTEFQRGDGGSPETFTKISGRLEISGPALSREVYDATDHDSPGGWEEAVAGIKRSGEVSFDIHYEPSVHDTLVGDLDDTQPRNYRLVFPDGAQWAFAAWMTGFEPTAPHDELLTASLTFKITGVPVLT